VRQHKLVTYIVTSLLGSIRFHFQHRVKPKLILKFSLNAQDLCKFVYSRLTCPQKCFRQILWDIIPYVQRLLTRNIHTYANILPVFQVNLPVNFRRKEIAIFLLTVPWKLFHNPIKFLIFSAISVIIFDSCVTYTGCTEKHKIVSLSLLCLQPSLSCKTK
jgi:hypothetical protein